MDTDSVRGHGGRGERLDPITVRSLNFELPEHIDPIFIPGEPEESCANLALSLLLPHLEPYLIRTMKAARPHVTSTDLLADLGNFNGQEGQHYRQHRRFNDAVQARRSPRLRELEEEVGRDYQQFTAERPLRFNLAYAEGFEALTTAVARFTLEQGLLGRMIPAARDLFTWHLIEELEHRTVAFDVYEHVCGHYGYRVPVALFAQWHMLRFVARATEELLAADPDLLPRYGGLAARRERRRRLGLLALRHLLPKVLATYTPWYTPRDIAMPEEARALAAHYSALAAAVGGR